MIRTVRSFILPQLLASPWRRALASLHRLDNRRRTRAAVARAATLRRRRDLQRAVFVTGLPARSVVAAAVRTRPLSNAGAHSCKLNTRHGRHRHTRLALHTIKRYLSRVSGICRRVQTTAADASASVSASPGQQARSADRA